MMIRDCRGVYAPNGDFIYVNRRARLRGNGYDNLAIYRDYCHISPMLPVGLQILDL